MYVQFLKKVIFLKGGCKLFHSKQWILRKYWNLDIVENILIIEISQFIKLGKVYFIQLLTKFYEYLNI